MIDVFIRKNDEHYTGFHVTGHAHYAEIGKDIVCAGVSALTITLEESLRMLTDAPIQTGKYINEENERIYIMRPDEKTDLLIGAYKVGIESIVDTYPEYVTLHLEK